MSRLLKKFEDVTARPGSILSRRSFLGVAARGTAALAALAAGLGLPERVFAYNYACCWLLYSFCTNDYINQGCPCSSSCPNQPCVTNKTQNYGWYCRDSQGCTWLCAECYWCTPCCSYAYRLCSPGCPCIKGAPVLSEQTQLLPMRSSGEVCH
jgi:hypothetical protein